MKTAIEKKSNDIAEQPHIDLIKDIIFSKSRTNCVLFGILNLSYKNKFIRQVNYYAF